MCLAWRSGPETYFETLSVRLFLNIAPRFVLEDYGMASCQSILPGAGYCRHRRFVEFIR